MNLVVTTQKTDPAQTAVLVVRPLERRLDASIAEEFKTKMLSMVKGGPRRVVLECGDVEFMDSSGLSALISLLKQLGKDGSVTICEAQEPVLNVLKLTRMDRVFRICASMDEAMAFPVGQTELSG